MQNLQGSEGTWARSLHQIPQDPQHSCPIVNNYRLHHYVQVMPSQGDRALTVPYLLFLLDTRCLEQLKRSGWCGLHGITKLCWRIIQQALNTHQSTNTLLFRSSSVKHADSSLASLEFTVFPSGPSDLWFTMLSLPRQLPDNDLEGTARITVITPLCRWQRMKGKRLTRRGRFSRLQSLLTKMALSHHTPTTRNLQVHGKNSPRLSCF